MFNWSNILSPIIGFIGVGASTAIYYRAKDLVNVAVGDVNKKLENYVLKECAVTHEQMLQHKIDMGDKYATICDIDGLKDSMDKLGTKLDDLIHYLMKKDN